MKHTIKKISTIRIKLEDGYYIDLVPGEKDSPKKEFWLHHKDHGKAMFMFGVNSSTDEDAIEMAIANAEDYIEEFKEDIHE